MSFSLNGTEKAAGPITLETSSFDETIHMAFGRSRSGQLQAAGNRQANQEAGFYGSVGKRAFDIIVGSMMLIAAAPLILGLMLVVARDGGKPIFAHTRVGRNGRRFKCLKIRSMRIDAEQQLEMILASDPAAAAEWAADHKLTNDPRVTRFGAFLRKSSLDELPQLVNVLRGDMSLVGPRPITVEEIQRYGDAAATYVSMKPGLTGPWQVSGRNHISFDERVAMDVNYFHTFGLKRDVWIIILTVLAVLKLTGK